MNTRRTTLMIAILLALGTGWLTLSYISSIQHANEAYTRARVEKEVDYLGQLAKMLRAIPGRKQIIFLSEGFDPSVVQGRDAREKCVESKSFKSLKTKHGRKLVAALVSVRNPGKS